MTEDLLRSVAQLTHRLRRAQAGLGQATGVRDGTDETGSITILIDDDGTARDVRVAADWRRRLNPAQVGSAVVAADAEAARRRLDATAAALARAQQSTSDGDASDRFSEVAPRPAAGFGRDADRRSWLTPVPPDGRRRPLAELTEAVLAAVDELDVVTAPPPPAIGIGAEGAVRITLARGRITECTADQAWLARQDDVTLAHALREAISMAATAALAARRPFIDYQQRLDAIVASARAALHELSQGPRP